MENEQNTRVVEKTRKLEELNLIDNFLFTEAAGYGEEGRKLCQIILETMLGRPLPYLKVEVQKIISGIDTDKHGIRLDVYLEDQELNKEGEPQESVYDIEMENREFHPKRARYYHSLTDRKLLNAGADYKTLGNVIVLIIMPKDPFGKGRMKYTIKRKVLEDPSIEYEDGDTTYYFFTKGAIHEEPQEVVEMLRYIEDSREENVNNSKIAEVHHVVHKVKRDKEVGVAYMKWADFVRETEEDAREAGMKAGLKAGMEAGMEAGREIKLVELIRKKRDRGIDAESCAEMIEEDVLYVRNIYEIMQNNPLMEDSEICKQIGNQ